MHCFIEDTANPYRTFSPFQYLPKSCCILCMENITKDTEIKVHYHGNAKRINTNKATRTYEYENVLIPNFASSSAYSSSILLAKP